MREASIFLLSLVAATGCTRGPELGPLVESKAQPFELHPGDFEKEVGWWPSAAFDSKGTPHLSYCDFGMGDLVYATKKDGAWSREVVKEKGAVGKYTSLSIGPNDEVAIAFHDQDAKELLVALQNPGDKSWSFEQIAYGTEVGMASKLIHDRAGNLHMFYYVPHSPEAVSGQLVHAARFSTANGDAAPPWVKRPITEAHTTYSASIDAIETAVDGEFYVSFPKWNFSRTTFNLARTKLEPNATISNEVTRIAEGAGTGWHSFIDLPDPAKAPLLYFTEFRGGKMHKAERIEDEWKTELVLTGVGNMLGKRVGDDLWFVYEDIKGAGQGKGLLSMLRLGPEGEKDKKRFRLDSRGSTASYVDFDTRGDQLVVAYYAAERYGLQLIESPIASFK